jgi:hypothetical protein
LSGQFFLRSVKQGEKIFNRCRLQYYDRHWSVNFNIVRYLVYYRSPRSVERQDIRIHDSQPLNFFIPFILLFMQRQRPAAEMVVCGNFLEEAPSTGGR